MLADLIILNPSFLLPLLTDVCLQRQQQFSGGPPLSPTSPVMQPGCMADLQMDMQRTALDSPLPQSTTIWRMPTTPHTGYTQERGHPLGCLLFTKGGGGSGSSTGAITRSNPAHSPHQKMKLLQDFASSSSIGTGSPVNPAWGNRRQKIPPRFMLASFMNLPCYTGSSKLALSEAELHHWLKRHRQKDPGSRSGYRIGDIRTDGYLEVLSAGQPEIDVRHAAVRQQAGASGVFSFRNTSGGNAPSTDASLLSNSTSHRNATKEKTWLSDLIIGLSPEQVMMVVIYHSTRIQ